MKIQPSYDNWRRFLLVERDPHTADLFAELFAFLGFEMTTVQSPLLAIEIAKQRVPDVIYTSLVFAEMSGFQLCAELRRIPQLAETRIIAVTGLSYPGLHEICISLGFDDYLLKPFTLDLLAYTISPQIGDKVREIIERDDDSEK